VDGTLWQLLDQQQSNNVFQQYELAFYPVQGQLNLFSHFRLTLMNPNLQGKKDFQIHEFDLYGSVQGNIFPVTLIAYHNPQFN
jgi:hypothetical protein